MKMAYSLVVTETKKMKDVMSIERTLHDILLTSLFFFFFFSLEQILNSRLKLLSGDPSRKSFYMVIKNCPLRGRLQSARASQSPRGVLWRFWGWLSLQKD